LNVDDKEDESYTEEDVHNYLMATEKKKKRSVKSRGMSTASNKASSKQRPDSDDDIEYNSDKKSYTREDMDLNGSDDNGNVPLSVIQWEGIVHL